ncbi:MAG: cytidine deaminase [Bacteroidales bacterium]|nr:cytidine deaminase [Bacteroidales bacterium]
MQHQLTIRYREYPSQSSLDPSDAELIQAAIRATEGSYSPYSNFRVGAAVRLANGTIVAGSNQENAAYPSGLCAERTALFAASAQHPQCRDFDALAIVGRNAAGTLCEASPCGACRQAMLEYEQQQGHPMRILWLTESGIREVESVSDLLPFAFALSPTPDQP